MNTYIQWRIDNLKRMIYSRLGMQKRFKYSLEKRYWKRYVRDHEILLNPEYLKVYNYWMKLEDYWYDDKKLLDIGSGMFDTFFDCHTARKRVCLDPLMETYKKLNPVWKSETIQGYSECIPFWRETFDYVFSFNSLDHVDDIELTIQEIYRVLKPKGLFIVFVELHEDIRDCEPIALTYNSFTMLVIEKFYFVKLDRFQCNGSMLESFRQMKPYTSGNSLLCAILKKKGESE